MKLPIMSFFVGDALQETCALSPKAAHAHMYLLCQCWTRGGELPADDRVLANVLRLSLKAWAGLKNEVLSLWERTENGTIKHADLSARMASIAERVIDNRKNGSLGGKANASKKANEINKTGLANATETLQAATVTVTATATNKEEEEEREAPPSASPAPPPSSDDKPAKKPAKKAEANQGCRLPERWGPDNEVVEAMVAELGVAKGQLRVEHRKFRDYWSGAAGAKGRKADWPATWRNWMRRAFEEQVRAPAKPSTPAMSPDVKARHRVECDTAGMTPTERAAWVRGNRPAFAAEYDRLAKESATA